MNENGKKSSTEIRFLGCWGSDKGGADRAQGEPQESERRNVYLAALPCEYREQGTTAEPASFYDLVTRYHISVDQFFFPNDNAEKSTQRRQLDTLLDSMSDNGLRIVAATAKEITEVEKDND